MAVCLDGLIGGLSNLDLSEVKILDEKKIYSSYSCPECKQDWYAITSETSEAEARPCINCSCMVLPKELDEEFVPKDKMYFGWYECHFCLRSWRSAYSWVDYFQKCKSCSTEVYPHVLTKLKKKKDKDDLTKPHEGALCEKCKKLGRCCKEPRDTYIWEVYHDEIDNCDDSDEYPYYDYSDFYDYPDYSDYSD